MSKKIVFYPTFADAGNFTDPPKPAIHFNIPEWFRDTPKYKHNQTAFSLNNGENNLTIRHCIPLLEGFTSGYVLVTNIDLLVEIDNSGRQVFKWIDGNVPIYAPLRSRPSYENLPENRSFPKMPGYSNPEFNWIPAWCIKTPKGYSSIFTHPINRLDLPFYTLGGIIDTDGWGEAGNHPFVLREGWEGVIPKGTPYVQIIPFKRDNWHNEIDTSLKDPFNHELNIRKRDSVLRGWYKKNAWNNKHYR
jgi:hypothetical protein